jgi:hypothetical protein
MANLASKLRASATGNVFSQSSRGTCAQQMVVRRRVRGKSTAWRRGREKLWVARARA